MDKHVEQKKSMSLAYLIAIIVIVGFSIFGILGYGFIAPTVGHGAFISFVSLLTVPVTVALVNFIRTELLSNQQALDREESRLARSEAREEARLAREEARLAAKEVNEVKSQVGETKVLAEETHKLVNSRLEEFKAAIEQLATARGYEAGMQVGREQANARTDALYAGQDSVIHHEGIIQHIDAPAPSAEQDQEVEREKP